MAVRIHSTALLVYEGFFLLFFSINKLFFIIYIYIYIYILTFKIDEFTVSTCVYEN
jgi:hypothetical protein